MIGWARAGVAAGCAAGLGLGREVTVEPPPGPPGRNSFPVVIGLATAFPFGVGLETELGDSPGPTWIVPLLYSSSRGTMLSFTTLTTAGLPGFLLYSILGNH